METTAIKKVEVTAKFFVRIYDVFYSSISAQTKQSLIIILTKYMLHNSIKTIVQEATLSGWT